MYASFAVAVGYLNWIVQYENNMADKQFHPANNKWNNNNNKQQKLKTKQKQKETYTRNILYT